MSSTLLYMTTFFEQTRYRRLVLALLPHFPRRPLRAKEVVAIDIDAEK